MATVALDAMGGDSGASVVVPAALNAVQAEPSLRVILVGDRDVLCSELERCDGYSGRESLDSPGSRIRIVHASQQVLMADPPAHALRSKRDSSMRVAIDLVKRREADACVSAGNTGALMVIARFVLKTLAGIDRPAIISQIPCVDGHVRMLDLGASVDASPEELYQFAVMGAVMAHAADGVDRPSVGLLNVGEEAIKGNEKVKQAAALLSASGLNYIGFVEGDDIYKGKANVIVCDGFSGNVCLKSSEGVAKMIAQLLRTEFERNWLTRLAGLIARPVLSALKHSIDPRRYNGATLVGLRGIVVKSHGGADVFAFQQAILQALTEINESVPEMISAHLEPMLTHEEAV